MEQYLSTLRDVYHYRPVFVYDIGAYEGLWTAMIKRIFPLAICYQFEANTDKKPFLAGSPYSFFEVLGETDDQPVTYYKAKCPNTSGNSVFREQTKFFEDAGQETRTTKTLKTVMEEQKLPVPNLMKLDVQGSELAILRGLGPELLSQVDLLILELSVQAYNKDAPLASEVISFLADKGFVLMDILDTLRQPASGVLIQFDALFRRESHPLFRPR